MPRTLFFPCLTVFLMISTGLCGAAFPGPLSRGLPAETRSVFFLDLARLRTVSAISRIPEMSVITRSADTEQQLKQAGISSAPGQAALFFTKQDCAILFQSELNADAMRRIIREKLLPDAETIRETKISSVPVFSFHADPGLSPGKMQNADPVLAFPQAGLVLFGDRAAVERILPLPMGTPDAVLSSLALLPDDSLAAGVLFPDYADGGIPASFWQGTGRIVFAVSYREGTQFPVIGSVLFFPSGKENYPQVYGNVRKYVEDAYAAGRKQGPVRPEMMFAFRVSPCPGFVRLDITLTEQDGIDFLTLLFRNIFQQ